VAYVLDTNVLSALRLPERAPAVEAWAAAQRVGDLFVSAFTIAEIERGIVAKERIDPEQGAILRRWFDEQVLPAFAGRVLAFDPVAARVLARYRVPENAPMDDALIAATAQAAGMVLVTGNARHVAPLGVACWDPWEITP